MGQSLGRVIVGEASIVCGCVRILALMCENMHGALPTCEAHPAVVPKFLLLHYVDMID